MSPEQAWGKDIDHRSDIYSLGLVMYEMIVGRKAFGGDSDMSILEQVRAPHLVPPREVDPSLPPDAERVLLKALRIDREERYQTAAEFATTLAQMLQSQQPAPAAGELGAFLNEMIGRQRGLVPYPSAPPAPVLAQTSVPARTAPEPALEAAPLSLEHEPPALEPALSPLQTAPRVIVPRPVRARRSSPIVVVGGLAVLLAAAAAGLYFARSKGLFAKGAAAQATPAPETLALAKEAVKQEVSRQTQALRERLASEVGVQPTAAAARAPAVVPTATQPAVAAGAPAAQRIRPAPASVVAQGQSAPALVPGVQPTPAPAAAAQPERQSAPVASNSVPQPANPAPAQPQTPAVQEGELVQLDAEVTLPEPIYTPKPSYPPLAERQRVSGTVLLDVLVDENGAVREVRVLRGVKPDLGLDAAAASAVQTWRYKPAVKNGVRVKVRITTAVGFRL
jgi:TonB family protein